MATYSYRKHGKIRLLRNPDLTDVDSDSSSDEQYQQPQQSHSQPTNNNHIEWCWESDYGYKPYDISVSNKLEQLSIGETYKLHINNASYHIKKTGDDKAIQTNLNNGLYRKAVRKSKNNPNPSQHNHDIAHKSNVNESKQSNNEKTNDELKYVWFYFDKNNEMNSFDYLTSKQLNKLKNGGKYSTYLDGKKYLFTKIDDDTCQQSHTGSNECNTVIRQPMSAVNSDNSNGNNIDQYKRNKNNHAWSAPKHHSNVSVNGKWNWKTDNGQWQPLSEDICNKLDALQVMKKVTVEISNSIYDMTKIASDIVQQKNVHSGNIREIRKK